MQTYGNITFFGHGLQFCQQQAGVRIQTEPVGKPALKVLFSVQAIIFFSKEKLFPTQESLECLSVSRQSCASSLHRARATGGFSVTRFHSRLSYSGYQWTAAPLPDNFLFTTDSQGHFCLKSPAWREQSCWLRQDLVTQRCSFRMQISATLSCYALWKSQLYLSSDANNISNNCVEG